MKSRKLIFALLVVLSLTATFLVLSQQLQPISFALPEAEEAKTYMVPMRDGVKLATDVYLPEGEGPWPAILIRTPYSRKGLAGPMKEIAKRGYAGVVQDTRGRFDSEGQALVFLTDSEDGYDTVEWIARQPWSNGKVGTYGGSATGITQNLMAVTQPPHLVCQYVVVAPSSLYHQAVFPGGQFRKEQIEEWLKLNRFPEENLQLMIAHPNYDEYWKKLDCEIRHHKVNVPVFQIGGWFDTFQQGTINSFVGIQTKGSPGAKGKAKLLIGPWTHGGMANRKQGELTFPINSTRPGKISDPFRWFDFWLKGIDTGVQNDPAVTYYVMGDVDDPKAPGNRWRTSSVWPPAVKPTPFYFQANGKLSQDKPKKPEKPQTYTYDPENPVPTRGGFNLVLPAGPMDQRPVENREDVLLFTTEPLKEPLEVTGRIKVHLWASSSAKDTDFVAKLCDVYPDGRSILLTDGILQARHRESLEKEKLLQPRKIYKFEIDLWSTSIVFNKGHRIRVAITSSNYPRYEANPNTGAKFRSDERKQKAANTIYHDPKHPSHILLPIATKEGVIGAKK